MMDLEKLRSILEAIRKTGRFLEAIEKANAFWMLFTI